MVLVKIVLGGRLFFLSGLSGFPSLDTAEVPSHLAQCPSETWPIVSPLVSPM